MADKKGKDQNDDEGNDQRKTIVIFGVSSFVGSNLAEYFKRHYKVIGTYHKTPLLIPGVLTLPCDVLAKEEVQLVLFAFKPDITIYCVGLSSISKCARQESLADALNTSGLFNVTEYCQRYKSKICYLSSNFVFAGEDKNYMEMDSPDAANVYGKTQAAAEFYVQKTSLNYAIFRCSRLYGRGINYKNPTWFENMQRKFRLNNSFTADNYISTGFLDIYYLGVCMKMCFDNEITNRLFQVSSQDKSTIYEFCNSYAEIFQESKELVSKAKWRFPMIISHSTDQPRSENLHFKLEVGNLGGFLNIKMPTIAESLEFTFQRFHGLRKSNQRSQQGEGVTFI